MKSTIKPLGLALAALICMSCDGQKAKPNPPTVISEIQIARIEGQIFVTRQDRETVKMSLVTVQIVETVAARKMLEKAQQQQFEARLATASDKEWRERSMALANALPSMRPEDAATARQTLASLRALVISNQPYVSPKIATANLPDLLRQMRWPSTKTVQTDADGVFTAEVPPGDWTLVAWAERKTPEKTEQYLWIVPARTGERILLNNSNVFSEGTP